MDVSSFPQLDAMSTSYCDRYESYKRYTDQQEKISEWISDKFDEEITSQLSNADLVDESATLSVLGIGSGNGKIEVQMLMQLKKKFRYIECTVVEPSAERITSYKKLVTEQKDALNSVTFDWHQESLQEFCKANADGSKKFHFVSAIHCCYFIPRQDLDFYLKVLSGWTEGKILIMQTAETSCFCRLQEKFLSSLQAVRPFIHAGEIMDSLNTLSINFETTVLPCECDVTSCFESDSRDGDFLLDFLLQVGGRTDDGPTELPKMIQDFLKTENISYTRNGRLYAPNPTRVITASTLKTI